MPSVTINGVEKTVPEGTGIGSLLAGTGIMGMPCGGHGRCGKCRVKVTGKVSSLCDREKAFLSGEEIRQGIRLACLVRAEGDCWVETGGEKAAGIRLEGDMPDIVLNPSFTSYGAAVDIGTTTLAARLYDREGKVAAQASCMNPQSGWGADVISRMEAAMGGAAEDIARAVRQSVDGLLEELADSGGISYRKIDGVVVTGNTAMLHLFTGTSVEPLTHAPFAVKRSFDEKVNAACLGLTKVSPEAEVYFPPCAGAFVGADLVTALLASGIRNKKGAWILVDIGTNGEMALLHGGRFFFCSTAAGPVFEGAGISRGMAGRPGAIDRVELRGGKTEVHVIGNIPPRGICGSGVVDAVACLLEGGYIDETGYMEKEEVLIAPDVPFTQKDVRMVQLAKSAIHAGIRTLLHIAGIGCGDVSGLLIAGGFGSFLNVENAGRMGLLPEELTSGVRVIGNAALSGAAMLLLNPAYRRDCRDYASRGEVVELSCHPFFAREYMDRMSF